MTPAEFKTIRQSLNLTKRDVARARDVSDRMAGFWESGGQPIHFSDAKWLLERDAEVEVSVKEQVASYLAVGDLVDVGEVLLLKLPSTAPNVIVGRVRQALMREGVKVEIRYSEDGE